MKYIITENRMQRLVGELIRQVYPDFAMGKCYVENMGNDDDPMLHFFKDKLFAKYHPWSNTLFLRKELFHTLEDYLGADAMTFALDWFNEEFGQHAESLDYI